MVLVLRIVRGGILRNMAVTKIDDGLLEEVVKFTARNHIVYPSVKYFVDQAIKEKLERIK